MAASLALAIPGLSNAAGLGRLTVLSALGQPLNAEVELLSVQKGETLSARLSSVENYQRANLPFNAALVSARVTVEKRPNGAPYLKVTTGRPVNEPFAELLIEINSEHGRVVRQYTVLLDPPGYGRSAGELPPPPVAAPTVRPAPGAEPAAAAPGAPLQSAPGPAAVPSGPTPPAPGSRTPPRRRGAAAPAAAPAESAAAGAGGRQYGPIQRGETLGKIAKAVQPDGVTLEQTLVGLYRHNPDAFIRKNMNLVKSGRILKVPEASELTAIGQREAVREVRLQVADFNSFRGRLADRAGAAAEDGSVASGRIGTRVARGEPAEPRDTVRLSRGDKGAKGGAADRVRALEEESVAREKALADANARIAQLEKTIQDMKRLADMKSGAAPADKSAAVPPAAKGQPTAPTVGAPVVPAPPAKAEPSQAAKGAPPAPPAKGPETVARAPEPAPGKAPEAPKPAAEAPKPPADIAKGPAPDAKGPADPAAAPGPVAKSDVPVKPKAKPAPPAPPPEPDLIDTIADEPLYLVAGAGVLVLSGLALVSFVRRRRGAAGAAEKPEPRLAPATGHATAPEADRSRRAEAAAAAAATSVEPARPASAPQTSAPKAPASTPSLSPEDNDLDFNANTRTVMPPAAEAPRAAPARAEAPKRVEPTGTPPRVAEPARTEYKPEPPKREEPGLRPAASSDDVLRPTGPAHVEPAPRTGAPLVRSSTTGLGAARSLEGGTPPQRATETAPKQDRPSAGRPTKQDILDATPAARQDSLDAAPSARQERADSSPLDLPDFSLEVPPAGSQSQSQRTPATPAASDFNMDFNLEPLPPIELPGEQKAEPAPAAQSNDLEFKLDDISLDFGSKASTAPGGSAKPKDDHWYDVQQKFDLAKAYEEMGDKDGARDILQEVVKEGDAEQQAQAKKLLSTLS